MRAWALVAKLIPRLGGASSDAEALAAARGIARILEAAGLDLHALAGLAEAQASGLTATFYRPHDLGAELRAEAARRRAAGAMQAAEVAELRRMAALLSEGHLGGWARQFVENMLVQLDLGVPVTAKQAAKLHELWAARGRHENG